MTVNVTGSLNSENIKVEPMDVYWGDRTRQVETTICVADVAGSLDDTGFNIPLADGTVKTVGFNETVPGTFDVDVTITPSDAATAVAAAIVAALPSESFIYSASADGASASFTLQDYGVAVAPSDISASAAGFTYDLGTAGSELENVGYIDGEMELNNAEQILDIMSHQTGTTVIGGIRTGRESSMTINFAETSTAQMKKYLENAGGNVINLTDTVSTAVGLGTTKDFTNIIDNAKQLVMHPRRNAITDRSEDWCFWNAYPALEAMTLSGENKLVVPATFRFMPDDNRDRDYVYGVFGDWDDSLFTA